MRVCMCAAIIQSLEACSDTPIAGRINLDIRRDIAIACNRAPTIAIDLGTEIKLIAHPKGPLWVFPRTP